METDRPPGDRDDEGLLSGEREPSKAKEALRAGSGEKREEKEAREAKPKPMASEGWFAWPFTLAVGVTSLGAAAALAAVHAQARARAGGEGSVLQSVGWVLGWGIAGSLLGFAAVKAVALWRRRKVGDTRLAAVRMFAATGLFLLVMNMGIAPTGWRVVDWPMAMGLATAVYLTVVWVSFRLTREDAMAVLMTHALLWLGVYGGATYGPRLLRSADGAAAQREERFEPPHAPATEEAPKQNEVAPPESPPESRPNEAPVSPPASGARGGA